MKKKIEKLRMIRWFKLHHLEIENHELEYSKREIEKLSTEIKDLEFLYYLRNGDFPE